MKNLMATAAVVGLLMTGTAYAAQTPLTDQQMDTVTAGGTFATGCIGGCYLPPMIGPEFSDFHWEGGYITHLQYVVWFGNPANP